MDARDPPMHGLKRLDIALAGAAVLAVGGLLVALATASPLAGLATALLVGGLAGALLARTRHGEVRRLRGEVRRLQGRVDELTAGQEQFADLLDNVDASLVAVDADHRVVICNQAFTEATADLAGIPAGPGVLFDDLIRPEKRAIFDDKLRRVWRGEPSRELLSFETRDGLVHREIYFRPLRRDGAVVGFTFEGLDVTERIEAQERLREANKRLVDLSRKAGMAEVATGILHDAGNILNSINVAAAQIAQDLGDLRVEGVAKSAQRLQQTGPPQLAAYLEVLHDHQRGRVDALTERARSLLGYIDHLKAVIASQRRLAGPTGAIESISLEDLADTALDLYAERIRDLGIDVVRDYDEVGALEMDRHRVLQILGNMVANACDALDAFRGPRRLHLRTRIDGDEARVEVEDNGIGIAAEDLDHLFKHGFTTKEGGHGFGLHASANAAHQMGGRMACTSDGPGRGARFTLALPAPGDAPS